MLADECAMKEAMDPRPPSGAEPEPGTKGRGLPTLLTPPVAVWRDKNGSGISTAIVRNTDSETDTQKRGSRLPGTAESMNRLNWGSRTLGECKPLERAARLEEPWESDEASGTPDEEPLECEDARAPSD